MILKFVYVIYWLSNGGSEKQLLLMAASLKKFGHEVEIYQIARPKQTPRIRSQVAEVERLGVKVQCNTVVQNISESLVETNTETIEAETIIDATGKLRNTTQIFTREFVTGEIVPNKGARTFYSQFGDIFSYLCLVLTVAISFLAYRY